jgi:protein-L-isoaspartate(D-aspartate) O-methyltransferase
MNESSEFQRQQMISQQVRCWYVLDEAVLRVMAAVPRELFVPDNFRDLAFADTSIPLGNGQYTLPPKVEGRLLQALELNAGDSVLMVGAGSGYLAACIAKLVKQLRCIEPLADIAEQARRNLLAAVINNVSIEVGSSAELNVSNSYDAVVVGGSLPVYDEHFERMLKPGGRLLMITGVSPVMQVIKVTRLSSNQWHRETLFETGDVPPLAGATNPPAFVF